MNRQIKIIFISFLILFSLLIFNLTYLQVIAGPQIASHPANTRAIEEELQIERGKIISSDGLILAESKRVNNHYERIYPTGELAAHVVGYSSPKYQKSGIEKEFNEYLLGKESFSPLEDLLRKFKKPEKKGNNLILTLDSRLQRIAVEDLRGKRGAVIALDPQTGAILAMASSPTFNPNTIDESWSQISQDKSAPLVNRATEGRYPPGSSFKIITSAAALEEQLFTPESPFTDTGRYEVLGTTVRNYNGKVFGEVTFEEGLEKSINTVFAQIGLRLGADRLVTYAEKFGFNSQIPFELPVKRSRIPRPRSMDEVEVAWSAIGQAKVLATPLQMALATAAIANDGTMMKPFLVKEIKDTKGEIIRQFGNEVWREVISSDTAETLTKMMVGVVKRGTGDIVDIPGYSVAAKTGTAELGAPGVTHAWFVAFAPVDNPKIAVAVIVEKGGTGGEAAGPIARDLIETALRL